LAPWTAERGRKGAMEQGKMERGAGLRKKKGLGPMAEGAKNLGAIHGSGCSLLLGKNGAAGLCWPWSKEQRARREVEAPWERGSAMGAWSSAPCLQPCAR
jgi:hypothetical protein